MPKEIFPIHRLAETSNLTEERPQQRILADLPTELWVDIFLHYAASIRTTPWILGHICWRWRHIALSISQLWNELPFLAMNVLKGSERVEWKKEMLHELLSRSKDAPLIFDIYGNVNEDNHEIISLLLHHSNRWEQAKVNGVTQGIQAQFVVTPILFHWLRSIQLHITDSNLKHITFLHHTSALCDVRIFNQDPNILSWDMIRDIPWSHIESYKEIGDLVGNFHQVLSASPHLLKLALYAETIIPLSPNHPNLNHYRLRVLNLTSENDSHSVSTLLASTSFPALEELKINLESLLPIVFDDRTLAFKQALVSFIYRSNCSLKKLQITGVAIGDVVPLLRQTPLLEELALSIGKAQDYDALCSNLVGKRTEATLVPYLRYMTLQLLESKFDGSKLAKLVSSRFHKSRYYTGNRLTAVQVSIRDRTEEIFIFTCALQGTGLLDLRKYSEPDHGFTIDFNLIGFVRNIVHSKEKGSKQHNLRHIFCILDLIHFKYDKINLLKQLKIHKLISSLEDKIYAREWILVYIYHPTIKLGILHTSGT